MIYLLFHLAANAAAAKHLAEPLRHRRHKVFLRDLDAWLRHRDLEQCQCVIVMAPEDVPEATADGIHELEAAYLKGVDPVPEIKRVTPDVELWPASEDEERAMTALNVLREKAALLGIEVEPAYDADRLNDLIAAAEKTARERQAQEDAEARDAEERAREAQGVREQQEATAASAPGAAEDGGADSSGSEATPPADDGADLAAQVNELAGIDHESADALREFAKKHNIPTNPNPRAKPETLMKAIRAALGIGE